MTPEGQRKTPPEPEDGDREARLQNVIDRYERLLDTKERLRQEADGDFVWTSNGERE